MSVPSWVAAAAALALLVAVFVAVVTAGGGSDPRPAPVPEQALRAPRDPFVIAGARWAVLAAPAQPWTRLVYATASPGAHNRWLLVAVRVRNLSRTDLDPITLRYRVVDDRGTGYAPDPALGTGPQAQRSSGAVGHDALSQAELAFRVPVDATDLRLVYSTTRDGGPKAATVVVPLGGA